MPSSLQKHPASYRDPSGYVFSKDGIIYRQVNQSFKSHFDNFLESGLYARLVEKQLLLPHQRLNENFSGDAEWYCTLQPSPVPYISYPYEWSFDMLKDAALLTLVLTREAVAHNMILKDASPYNVQWYQGALTFIDSLSFETYREEEPWIAYRQFCEHFLAPLLLMHYRKQPLQEILLAWPDGVPLAVASALLPGKSRFSLHTWLHIHLHNRISSRRQNSSSRKTVFNRQKLLNLLSSLEGLVKKLELPRQHSNWSGYYDEAGDREGYLEIKTRIIREWLGKTGDIKTSLDLGANEGLFSKEAAAKNIYAIASDQDPFCINTLYRSIRNSPEKNIQPLVMDLSHPSPSIGFDNQERSSFTERFQSDLVLALALVHHLAIGKNIPLESIGKFFGSLCRKWMIIEFVPKTDQKIREMLSVKKDIYDNYSEERFEAACRLHFEITEKKPVGTSGRILYLVKKV